MPFVGFRWWALLLLVCAPLFVSCRHARAPDLFERDPMLRIEIADASTGKRLLGVGGVPVVDPLDMLTRPMALLLPAKGETKARFVQWTAQRRGERMWVRTVVTRIDDDTTLRAVFELAMMERQLMLCAYGPCPKGLTQKSIDDADARLPRVHSLASFPLAGPFEWRARTPDGGDLSIREWLG